MEVLKYKIAPKILNEQDPAIKYRVEFEDHKHSLNFH